MRCLNKPIRIGATLLALFCGISVAPFVCVAQEPTEQIATAHPTAASTKIADLTFPSGLVLAVSPEGFLLLTKNGQTIRLTYTQTLALLNELVSLQSLERETADKTKNLLNRLLNEQSDSLSSAEIMGLDKPLSLVKSHYKGPTQQDPLNKLDTGIPLDNIMPTALETKNPSTPKPTPSDKEPPRITPPESLLNSTVVRHNPVVDDLSKEKIAPTPPSLDHETLTDQDFDESDIPDGPDEERDTDIPLNTEQGEDAATTPPA